MADVRAKLAEIARRLALIERHMAHHIDYSLEPKDSGTPMTAPTHALASSACEAAQRVRDASYYVAIVRDTDGAKFYADNRWCAKCLLFGDSPCADAYVAYNTHNERAESGDVHRWFHGVSELRRLDQALGMRMMRCFFDNPGLLSEERMAEAEAEADAYVAELKQRLTAAAERSAMDAEDSSVGVPTSDDSGEPPR